MKVTAAQLVNATNGAVDRVQERAEKAKMQRHGKTKVETRRMAGVSKAELLKILKSVRFAAAEPRQLMAAIKQAVRVTGVI